MKTLILGDLHTRFKTAQKIIDFETPDRTIFLGDYFDNFYDTPVQNSQTALWVKGTMASNPDNIFLWGNHDLNYRYHKYNEFVHCSGYTDEKYIAINSILEDKQWDNFKFYYWLNDYTLLTHAGLHKQNLCSALQNTDANDWFINLRAWLEDQVKYASERVAIGHSCWLFSAGYARGGRNDYGGILWNDWYKEFIHKKGAIKNLNQIFGHTITYKTIKGDNLFPTAAVYEIPHSYNVNLDTNSYAYGIWENDKLTTKSAVDLYVK